MTTDQSANAFAQTQRIPTGHKPTALTAFGLFDRLNNVVLHVLDGILAYTGTLAVTGAATISSTLAVTGAATISSTLGVTGLTTLTGGLVGTPQAMIAAGAVNLTTLSTTIASAGAIALTLADGTSGQVKVISMITDGGDATLTPAHLQGGTTLTFNDAGDTVVLQFLGTKWMILSNNGATLA